MSNFIIKINKTHRPWYWPFARKPIFFEFDKKFDLTVYVPGQQSMHVSGYIDDDGKITTVMSCGDSSDGIEKIRFKQVTAKSK